MLTCNNVDSKDTERGIRSVDNRRGSNKHVSTFWAVPSRAAYPFMLGRRTLTRSNSHTSRPVLMNKPLCCDMGEMGIEKLQEHHSTSRNWPKHRVVRLCSRLFLVISIIISIFVSWLNNRRLTLTENSNAYIRLV